MNENITYPYSDELMIFNETDKRYYITEKALAEAGSDLREMLDGNDTVRADLIIKRLLTQTTTIIYNFIHSNSVHNGRQDRLIAHCPAVRPIIYRALLSQAEYLILNGDPSRSLDRNIRDLGVDEQAIMTLSETIPGLGASILYSGV